MARAILFSMADDTLPARIPGEELFPYDVTRLDRISRPQKRGNNAVFDAFDLIGGVPRLAIWADKNPDEFFTKIFTKVITTNQQTEHSGEITIRSAVPRTALDGEYKDVTPDE